MKTRHRQRKSCFFRIITIWIVITALLYSNAIWAQGIQSFKTNIQTTLVSIPLQIDIPQHLGYIKESWHSQGQLNLPPVVLIQDSHCNYEAQKNIYKIIQFLNSEDPASIGVIGLEGAAGNINLDLFTSIPDDKTRTNIAEYYLKQGYLTGAEYYTITSQHKIPLYGVEEPRLYFKNLNAFQKSVQNKEPLTEYIRKLKDHIQLTSPKILSKLQRHYVSLYERFHSGKLSLTEYCQYLVKLSHSHNSPQTQLLIKSIHLEKKIDFDALETERGGLLDYLENKLVREDKTKLVQISLYFRLNRISPCEYYEYLQKLKTSYGCEDHFRNLDIYIKLLKLQEELNIDKLNTEIEFIESNIHQELFKDPAQHKLLNCIIISDILERLVHLRVTRKELNYYLENRPKINAAKKAQAVINNIEQFYKLALQRDQVLTDNFIKAIPKQNLSVLVTGGFHTTGITESLRSKNIPYIVISPRLTKHHSCETYLKVMRREKNAFEKLLEQTGLRLSPVLIGENGLSDPLELRLIEKEVGIYQISLTVPNIPMIQRLRELTQYLASQKQKPKPDEAVISRLERQIGTTQSLILKDVKKIIEEFIKNYIKGKTEQEQRRIKELFARQLRVLPPLEINGESIRFTIEIGELPLDITVGGEQGLRIGSYSISIQGHNDIVFLPKPQFPLREGKGALSKDAKTYIEGPYGKKILEQLLQAKEFNELTGGIKYVDSPCLTEANILKKVCEVNEKLVAIISFLLERRFINEEAGREFYKFLLHHEQAHASLEGRGYTHEFIIHLGDYFRLNKYQVNLIANVLTTIRDQQAYIESVLGIDVLNYSDISSIIGLLEDYSLITDYANDPNNLNDAFQLFLGDLVIHLGKFHPEVSLYQDIQELVNLVRTQFMDFLLEYISRGSFSYQSLSIIISLFEPMRIEAVKKRIVNLLEENRTLAIEAKVYEAAKIFDEFRMADPAVRLSIIQETVVTRGIYGNMLKKLPVELFITPGGEAMPEDEIISALTERKELFKGYNTSDLEILLRIINYTLSISMNAEAIAENVIPPVRVEKPVPAPLPAAEPEKEEPKKPEPPPLKKDPWTDSLTQDLAAILTKEIHDWVNLPPLETIYDLALNSAYLKTHPKLKDFSASEIKVKIDQLLKEENLLPFEDPIEAELKKLRHYHLFWDDLPVPDPIARDMEIVQNKHKEEFIETVQELGKIDVYQLDKEEKNIIREYTVKIFSSDYEKALEYAEQLLNYITLRNIRNRYTYFQYLSYIEVECSTLSWDQLERISALSSRALELLIIPNRIFPILANFQCFLELSKDPDLNKCLPYIWKDIIKHITDRPQLHEVCEFVVRSGNSKLKILYPNIVIGGKEIESVRFQYLIPFIINMDPSGEMTEEELADIKTALTQLTANELRQFLIELASLIKTIKSLNDPSAKICQNASKLEMGLLKVLPAYHKISRRASVKKDIITELSKEKIDQFLSQMASPSDLERHMSKGPAYRLGYLLHMAANMKDSKVAFPELIKTVINCMKSPYEIMAFLHSFNFTGLEPFVQDILAQKFGQFSNDPRLMNQIDDIITRSYFQFSSNLPFFLQVAARNSYFREYLVNRIFQSAEPLAHYCWQIYFGYLSQEDKKTAAQQIHNLIEQIIKEKGYLDIVFLDVIFNGILDLIDTDDLPEVIDKLVKKVQEKFRHNINREKTDQLDIGPFILWLKHFIEMVNSKKGKPVLSPVLIDALDHLILQSKPPVNCNELINKHENLNAPFDDAKGKDFILENKQQILQALGEMEKIDIYQLTKEEKLAINQSLDRIFSASNKEEAMPFIEELKEYLKADNTENRYLYMTLNLDSRIWSSKFPVPDRVTVKIELLKTCDLLDKYVEDKPIGFIQRMIDIQRFLEALDDQGLAPEQIIHTWHLISPKIQPLLIHNRDLHSIITLSGNNKLKCLFSDQLISVSRRETGDFLVWYYLHQILDLAPKFDSKGTLVGGKLGEDGSWESETDIHDLVELFRQIAVFLKIHPDEAKFQLKAVLSAIKTIERVYQSTSLQVQTANVIRKTLNDNFDQKLLKGLNRSAKARPPLVELSIDHFKKETEDLSRGTINEDTLFKKYRSSPIHRIFFIYQYLLLANTLPDKTLPERLKPIVKKIIQEISSPYEISALFVLAAPHVLPGDIYKAIARKISQFLSTPDTQKQIFQEMLFRSFDNYTVHTALILNALEGQKDFNPLIKFIAEGGVLEHAYSMQALYNFLSQRLNIELLLDSWKALVNSTGLVPNLKTQYFFTAPLLHLLVLKDYEVNFIDLWKPAAEIYTRNLSEGNYEQLNILAFIKMLQAVILQYYPSPPPGYEPETIQDLAEGLIKKNLPRLIKIAISKINEFLEKYPDLDIEKKKEYSHEVMDHLGLFDASVRENILAETVLKKLEEEPPAEPPAPPEEEPPPVPPQGDDLSMFLSRTDIADKLKDPNHYWKHHEFEVDTDEAGVSFIPYKYQGRQRIAFIQTRVSADNIIIKPQFDKSQWIFYVYNKKEVLLFKVAIDPDSIPGGTNPFYQIDDVTNQLIREWIEAHEPRTKPFTKNVVVTRSKKDGVPRNAGFDLCFGFRKKYKVRIIRGILGYIKSLYQKLKDDEDEFKNASAVLVKPQEIDPLNKFVEVYGQDGVLIGRYWIVIDGEVQTGAVPLIEPSEEDSIKEKLRRFHSRSLEKREMIIHGIRRRLFGPRRRGEKTRKFQRHEEEPSVNHLFSWKEIQDLVEFYQHEGTPVKRLFVDLDEVIMRPKGFIASEPWIVRMIEQYGIFKAKKEWRSHEERMAKARFFEFVEPGIRDILKRLRDTYGIDIVIVTARGEEDYERTKTILDILGLEINKDVGLLCAGGSGMYKLNAIRQYIDAFGDIKTGELNLFLDDKPYSVAVIRDKGKDLSMGDILAYCYTNPKDYESITEEDYLSLARDAEDKGNLENAREFFLNAQEYYLNLLEYSQKIHPDKRLEIYRKLSAKIEEFQRKKLDVTALVLSFLPKVTAYLKDIQDKNIPSPDKSQIKEFEELLFRYFKFYFNNNKTFQNAYIYWRTQGRPIPSALKKVIPIISPNRTNQGRFQEYEIEINADNTYLFLEPALEYIAEKQPDVVFVIDTGARPFLSPIQHFITRCGLPAKVILLPVSYKNVGDTEFEINRLLLESMGEIFPLTDKKVLLVDDNVVSGGTIWLMENVLTKYGIQSLATATPMRFNSDRLREEDVISAFNTTGRYQWKRDRPPVAVLPCWDQDRRRHLRGVKRGLRFEGFMREPLTGKEAGEAEEFNKKLVSNFRQALREFGQPLLEKARSLATAHPEVQYDLSDDGVINILVQGNEKILELLTSPPVDTLSVMNRLLGLIEPAIFLNYKVIRKILLDMGIYPARELIDYIRTKLTAGPAGAQIESFWQDIKSRQMAIQEGKEEPDFNSPLDQAIYYKNTFMKYEQYLRIVNLYLKAYNESDSPVRESFGALEFEVEKHKIKLSPARGLKDLLDNYTVMEDPYGDQLFYPDFINYNIQIDGVTAGRLNLLNLSDALNPSAKILYFKSLQLYDNFPHDSLDTGVFIDALLEQLAKLHDTHNYHCLLIPPGADIYLFSRNQEVRRYFEKKRWGASKDTPFSLAQVNQLLKLELSERNIYYRPIQSRLETLKPDFTDWQNNLYQLGLKFLMPAPGDKPVIMPPPGQLNLISEGFIRLLNWRFDATKQGYPPVIIHKKLTDRDQQAISEWEKEEEFLRKVLFDDLEKEIFRSICEIKRLNEPLHPGQEKLYQRLWDRLKVGRVETEELSDWQIIVLRDIMVSEIPPNEPFDSERFNFNNFLKQPSTHIENWSSTQRSRWLRYQAIELYEEMRSLKQQGYIAQTPTWFYTGSDGIERGIYLAQYLIKEILPEKDITKIGRKDFVNNGLGLVWDRVFNRDLFQIACAVYPDQFQLDEEGKLIPKPLRPEEIKGFIEGTPELAVGRSFKGKINLEIKDFPFQNTDILILVENDLNQGIVLNIYKDHPEKPALLATYQKRELKNGAYLINLAMADIIDYCLGKEGIQPGKKTIIPVNSEGNIEISGEIILKDAEIPPGENAILVLEKDINHGTILNIYPKGKNRTTSQYLFIKRLNNIAKVDLALHDLFNYYYGARHINVRPGIRVEVVQPVSSRGKLELSYLDQTIKINIPALSDKRALLKLENDENEGLVLNIYDYEEYHTLPGHLVCPKLSYLFRQTGLPSQEIDLRLKSIVNSVYGIPNVFGYETMPKPYFSTSSVPPEDSMGKAFLTLQFGDKTIRVPVPKCLINRRIAVIPQPHHQYGYIFEIHDLEQYLEDPYRPHDTCLRIDRENNTLVPYTGPVVSLGEQQQWLDEARRLMELYGELLDLNNEQLLGLIMNRFPHLKMEQLHQLVRKLRKPVSGIRPTTRRKAPPRKKPALPEPTLPAEKLPAPLADFEKDLVREVAEIIINNQYKKINPLYEEDENKAKQYILRILDETKAPDEISRRAMLRAKKILIDAIEFNIKGIAPAKLHMIKLYQRINLIYLLDRDSLYSPQEEQRYPNKILADDPGLGKTLEILLFILNIQPPQDDGPLKVALVVPNAAKEQWEYEIKQWVIQKQPIEVTTTADDALHIRIPQAALNGHDIELILYNFEAVRVTLIHSFNIFNKYLQISQLDLDQADIEKVDETVRQFFRDTERFDPYLSRELKDTVRRLAEEQASSSSIHSYRAWESVYTKKLIRHLNKRADIYNRAVQNVKTIYDSLIRKSGIDWIREPEKAGELLWEEIKKEVNTIYQEERIDPDAPETAWIDRCFQKAFYKAVRQRYNRLKHVQDFAPFILIADESHTIRTETTLTTESVRAISADRKLYLTATPLVGRDYQKLFTQLNSLYPDIFTKETFDHNFPNTPAGAIRLKNILTRFMIRREAKDVTDLPPVNTIKDRVELSGVEREISDIIEEVIDEYFMAMGSHLTPDQVDNRALRAQQASNGLFVLAEYLGQLQLMAAVWKELNSELKSLLNVPSNQFKESFKKLVHRMNEVMDGTLPAAENPNLSKERTIIEIRSRLSSYKKTGGDISAFTLLNPKEYRILDLAGQIPGDYVPAKIKRFAEIAEDILGRVHLTAPDRKTVLATLQGRRISRPAQWNFSLYTKRGEHIQNVELIIEKDEHGSITGLRFKEIDLPQNITPGTIDPSVADIRGTHEWSSKIKGEKDKGDGFLYNMGRLEDRMHNESFFEKGIGYTVRARQGKVHIPVKFDTKGISGIDIKIDPQLAAKYGLHHDDVYIFPKFYPINGVLVPKGTYDNIELLEDTFIPVVQKEATINKTTYPIVFEKLAVLSRFVSVTRKIRELFGCHGISYVAEEVCDRSGEIGKFRSDPSTPLYIGTTDQNYQALSLITDRDILPHHVARTMVLYDLFWQPLDQISLRMRRQGQPWPVNIHIFMGNATDESRFFDVSETREVQELVIGGRVSLARKRPTHDKTFIELKILFARTKHFLRLLKRETFKALGRNPNELKQCFNNIAQEHLGVLINTPMFTQSIAMHLACLPFLKAHLATPSPRWGFDSRLPAKERLALEKLKVPYQAEINLDIDNAEIHDLELMPRALVQESPKPSLELPSLKSPLGDQSLDIIFSEILNTIPPQFIPQVLAEYERVLTNHGILALSFNGGYENVLVKILTEEFGFELLTDPAEILALNDDIISTITGGNPELIERLKSDIDTNTKLVILKKKRDKQRDIMGVKTTALGDPLPAELQRYIDETARITEVYTPLIERVYTPTEIYPLPKPYPADLRELSYNEARITPRKDAEPSPFTLKPGSIQMAKQLVQKYFGDGKRFTVRDYTDSLAKEGYTVSDSTIRRDLEKLIELGLLHVDKRNRPYYYYLGKDKNEYRELAKKVAPILIKHVDTDLLTRILPKEGVWRWKLKYTKEGLLDLVSGDETGSIAAELLDVFLAGNINMPGGTFLTEEEREVLECAKHRLQQEKFHEVANEIIDSLENQLRTIYMLIDIDRLDAERYGDIDKIIQRLTQLKEEPNCNLKIAWTSHRLETSIEIEAFVRGLLPQDLSNDVFIPNHGNRSPAQFASELTHRLMEEDIPLQSLVLLTTPENYQDIYQHIPLGLRLVRQSFSTTERLQIPLSEAEYEQLKPFLPDGINQYIKYADGHYLLEFIPLEHNQLEILDLLNQARQKVSRMA